MKFLIYLGMSFLSINLYGVITLSSSDGQRGIYTGDEDSQRVEIFSNNEDEGLTETDAVAVYIPFSSGGTEEQFSLLSDGNGNSSLPKIVANAGTFADIFVHDPYIEIQFSRDADSAEYFYLAVSDDSTGGDYIIVNVAESSIFTSLGDRIGPVSVDITTSLFVPFEELCSSGHGYCHGAFSAFTTSAAGTQTSTEQLVFLFSSSDPNLQEGSTINVDDFEDGIFLELHFGNIIPTTLSGFTYDDLVAGDSSASATLSGVLANNFSNLDEIYRVVFLASTQAITAGQGLYQSPQSSDLIVDYDPTSAQWPENFDETQGEGTFLIPSLSNGTSYHVAASIANNYQFVSGLTASKTVSPFEASAFLKEKSCFIVAAGFQKNHFVLDSFRWIRDHLLLADHGGKIFVSWYYRVGPQWARLVLQDSRIQKKVKLFSYGVFTLLGLALILSLSFLVFFIVRGSSPQS